MKSITKSIILLQLTVAMIVISGVIAKDNEELVQKTMNFTKCVGGIGSAGGNATGVALEDNEEMVPKEGEKEYVGDVGTAGKTPVCAPCTCCTRSGHRGSEAACCLHIRCTDPRKPPNKCFIRPTACNCVNCR